MSWARESGDAEDRRTLPTWGKKEINKSSLISRIKLYLRIFLIQIQILALSSHSTSFSLRSNSLTMSLPASSNPPSPFPWLFGEGGRAGRRVVVGIESVIRGVGCEVIIKLNPSSFTLPDLDGGLNLSGTFLVTHRCCCQKKPLGKKSLADHNFGLAKYLEGGVGGGEG